MSEFTRVRGFEDVWRPAAGRRRTPEEVLGADAPLAVRQRLQRIVHRTPEVMVKVTGRTRDRDHLRSHLDYISRNGRLTLEDADRAQLHGRSAVLETALDWAELAELDPRRRSNSPFSVAIILSMPKRTDPERLQDAARAFAAGAFGDRFDYVMALHTDTDHPHVHLSVRALGYSGERLNPKKADLQAWRERFAEALRDRGIEAEATPRRTRGVVRKATRGPIRRIEARSRAGGGGRPRVQLSAYRDAAKALQDALAPEPWAEPLRARRAYIQGLFTAQAIALARSTDPDDRRLAAEIVTFLGDLPELATQRDLLMRALSGVHERASPERAPSRRTTKER